MGMSLHSLQSIGADGKWRDVAAQLMSGSIRWPVSVEDFETYWIEAGHRIREQVADDTLVCELLPPYRGDAMTLYMGENRSRFARGKIGLNWTTEVDVARMFASGLNAIDGGGVLLRARFFGSKIIAGPNAHSIYLQEYQFTVEPPPLETIDELEYFPSQPGASETGVA
jgi:hypothetical protein